MWGIAGYLSHRAFAQLFLLPCWLLIDRVKNIWTKLVCRIKRKTWKGSWEVRHIWDPSHSLGVRNPFWLSCFPSWLWCLTMQIVLPRILASTSLYNLRPLWTISLVFPFKRRRTVGKMWPVKSEYCGVKRRFLGGPVHVREICSRKKGIKWLRARVWELFGSQGAGRWPKDQSLEVIAEPKRVPIWREWQCCAESLAVLRINIVSKRHHFGVAGVLKQVQRKAIPLHRGHVLAIGRFSGQSPDALCTTRAWFGV